MQRPLFALLTALLVFGILGGSAAAQATPPFAATVLQRANLRGGPGTTFAVVGSAAPGQAVNIAACNDGCTWYNLDTGAWIAAFLVEPRSGDAPTAAPAPTTNRPHTMPDPASMTTATITSITDGDTIRVIFGGAEYRVRYIGMNTPEVGTDFAAEATAANRALVSGQTVYLEKDVSETDRYGRLLRYIWLADGTFVNYELVRQGYAQVATYPPDVKYQALYLDAQRLAQAEGKGLWAEQTTATVDSPTGPTANRNANLRGGPGTNFPVVGGVTTGQSLPITGRNAAGDWYQLASGVWIAAFLVNDAPSSLPIVGASVVSGSTTVAPTPVPPNPQAACDCSGNLYNCARFSTQSQAQACMNTCIAQGRGDIHRLDGDNDGIACETLP